MLSDYWADENLMALNEFLEKCGVISMRGAKRGDESVIMTWIDSDGIKHEKEFEYETQALEFILNKMKVIL